MLVLFLTLFLGIIYFLTKYNFHLTLKIFISVVMINRFIKNIPIYKLYFSNNNCPDKKLMEGLIQTISSLFILFALWL